MLKVEDRPHLGAIFIMWLTHLYNWLNSGIQSNLAASAICVGLSATWVDMRGKKRHQQAVHQANIHHQQLMNRI